MGAIIAAVFYVATTVWGVYAFVLTMNHAGVWPFSYLGAG